MIDDNYFVNYNNASFAILEIISDYSDNVYFEKISLVIKDFLESKYVYQVDNSSTGSEYKYSFSTNITLPIADFPISSGRIDFVISLVDCENNPLENYDAFYGIDNCASIYFDIEEDSINFKSNK